MTILNKNFRVFKQGDRYLDGRRISRQVHAGGVAIGGDAPISIQSMTKTRTEDIDATVEQIRRLSAAGCDIVRCAVPNEKAASALKEIVSQVNIPVVADIHFNYRLALLALESGVQKIRINPGNIGKKERVEFVLKTCSERGVPIRIGINSGSLDSGILKKHGHPNSLAMVESAIHHINICEENQFQDIVISLKSSDVTMMITAYRLLARKIEYPLHVGVTEAGPVWSGTIKSAVGIGTVLAEGIGDTIRVSLTGEPEEEIRVGREILKILNLGKTGVTIISCPTCGRLDTPELSVIATDLEMKLSHLEKDLTIAVMGCAVNGPGEAREADLGVACGKNEALLFKRGKILGKIKSAEIVDRLYNEALQFE